MAAVAAAAVMLLPVAAGECRRVQAGAGGCWRVLHGLAAVADVPVGGLDPWTPCMGQRHRVGGGRFRPVTREQSPAETRWGEAPRSCPRPVSHVLNSE